MSQVVKIDRFGALVDGGNTRSQNPQNAINLAHVQQDNRALAHAETGRLSTSGGTAKQKDFLAVAAFEDVDVATGTIGSTKATLDASLALVNDGLAAIFADANTLAAALVIPQVTYAGGGTAADPIDPITDSGTALTTSADAATMNPIRDEINTNMHTAAALVNKIARAIGHEPVNIEVMPDRQPPPDDYAGGSTGTNPGTGTTGGGGSGEAFGANSPFTNPTPAITEDSGTHVSPGITKVALDAALVQWADNVETLATRLAVYTNTVVALTDSTTGTAGAAITDVAAFPADTADAATSLADKTTTEAEMTDIRAALASLFGKANELATGMGAAQRTYDGTGTVSDTLAAIGAVTPAATGVQQTEMNAFLVEVEEATDACAEFVNVLCGIMAVEPISRVVVTSSFPFDNPVNPQQERSTMASGTRFLTSRQDPSPGATIPVDGGTAADPGQQAADVDSRFGDIADNLATLAAKINSVRTALAGPLVRIV